MPISSQEIMEELKENPVSIYVKLKRNFLKLDISDVTNPAVKKWRAKYVKFFVLTANRKEMTKPEKQDIYFSALESYKKVKCCDIDDAISIMKDFTGKFEFFQFSFVTKAIHMLNDDLPIIDENVSFELENIMPELGKSLTLLKKLRATEKTERIEKIRKAEELYKMVNLKIHNIINSKEGERIINEFDSYFPEYKDELSPVKKIDFYYWKKYDLRKKARNKNA